MPSEQQVTHKFPKTVDTLTTSDTFLESFIYYLSIRNELYNDKTQYP